MDKGEERGLRYANPALGLSTALVHFWYLRVRVNTNTCRHGGKAHHRSHVATFLVHPLDACHVTPRQPRNSTAPLRNSPHSAAPHASTPHAPHWPPG